MELMISVVNLNLLSFHQKTFKHLSTVHDGKQATRWSWVVDVSPAYKTSLFHNDMDSMSLLKSCKQ
eukprot:scaffold187_cov266-Chaetoceros_neogracile.AAC.25